MKHVLLTTYPTAFLHQGGGEREIHLLNHALNAAGIMSEIYGPESKSLTTYQAAIHFSMLGGAEPMIDTLAQAGLKMILWPNLWFVQTPTAQHIAHLTEILSRFDAVVFRSRAEETHFRQYLELSGKEIIYVSPLVSPKFQQKDISKVFPETYGLTNYAIWTGIIEPQKNQLAAVRAFKDLDIDLIISGQVRDSEYAKLCMSEATENIKFIPALPFASDLHLSALANSRFIVELPLDFPGTSALEAAMMGCQLLLSRSAWTEEMFSDLSVQVAPTDINAIRNAVIDMLDPTKQLAYSTKAIELKTSIELLVEYLHTH
jgi:glycosyltransferase involved in cell wall biosynthesis